MAAAVDVSCVSDRTFRVMLKVLSSLFHLTMLAKGMIF